MRKKERSKALIELQHLAIIDTIVQIPYFRIFYYRSLFGLKILFWAHIYTYV